MIAFAEDTLGQSFEMAAFAHPGPPAKLVDVSSSTTGGPVNLLASGLLEVQVLDAFDNPVANANVAFTADPDARLVRIDSASTTAPTCDFKIPSAKDSCAVPELTATTFSSGRTHAHLALGPSPNVTHSVTATVGAQSVVLERSTGPLPGLVDPDDATFALQTSATDAAWFAIVNTENNDAFPVTAITWRIACEDTDADGTCDFKDGKAQFSTTRVVGQPIELSTEGDGCFAANGTCENPQSIATGAQTSIDGTGRVGVSAPEVAAWLTGGSSVASNLLRTVSAQTPAGPISPPPVPGDDSKPVIEVEGPKTVSLTCALNPKMTPGTFCEGAAGTATCLADPAGITTYVDLRNGATENNVFVLRINYPVQDPYTGNIVAKFSEDLRVDTNANALDSSYFDASPDMGGVPGLYTVGNRRLESVSPTDFLVPVSEAHQGCTELITKSYQRLDHPLSPGPPKDATLRFYLVTEAEDAVSDDVRVPGWVDLVASQGAKSGDPREGSRTCPEGTDPLTSAPCRCDCVLDWVQLRAWDYYDNPPHIPSAGVAEPTIGDPLPTADIIVSPEEVAEVFSTPERVLSADLDFGVFEQNPAIFGFTLTRILRGASEGDWTIQNVHIFNVIHPELRTNGSRSSHIWADIESEPTQTFNKIAAHEARHGWQFAIGGRTGPDYLDDESLSGLPRRNPDNNDDIRYYKPDGSPIPDAQMPTVDCLPERAILFSGEDIGGPTGSAGEIIDSAANRELTVGADIGGEVPADDLLADECTSDTDIARKALERDAERFSRVLDEQ